MDYCNTTIDLNSITFVSGNSIFNKMMRHLLVFVLTVFQDNYVRTGTLLGLLAGFWSTEIIGGELTTNALIYGFIGWGVGVYLGHNRSKNSHYPKKNKFKVFQGGR